MNTDILLKEIYSKLESMQKDIDVIGRNVNLLGQNQKAIVSDVAQRAVEVITAVKDMLPKK